MKQKPNNMNRWRFSNIFILLITIFHIGSAKWKKVNLGTTFLRTQKFSIINIAEKFL